MYSSIQDAAYRMEGRYIVGNGTSAVLYGKNSLQSQNLQKNYVLALDNHVTM